MGRAVRQTQQAEVSQYYFGYLRDAVGTFEDAVSRLKHCDISQCDVVDATNMAHRIKGNAAMYGYVDLGLAAKKVEASLRSSADHFDAARALTVLVDDIYSICDGRLAAKPQWSQDNLAVVPTMSQDDVHTFRRKRVVIAYRDAWLCDLMASLLESEFEVFSCHTGTEAEGLIIQNRPDMVVLENALEDMQGLDLLRSLKSSEQMKTLPVFIALDPDTPDAIAEAISLGAEGFAQDKHEILEVTNFVKSFLTKPAQSVLVVDDDPVVRDLLTHSLKSAGLTVDVACDGLEALDYLSKNKPDLVLLDRFMPRLEGGTVLYEIRNKINLKSIPVLILTAMVNRGEAKSWFERGAADFIPKPFDPEEVLMRVKQHLETKRKTA